MPLDICRKELGWEKFLIAWDGCWPNYCDAFHRLPSEIIPPVLWIYPFCRACLSLLFAQESFPPARTCVRADRAAPWLLQAKLHQYLRWHAIFIPPARTSSTRTSTGFQRKVCNSDSTASTRDVCAFLPETSNSAFCMWKMSHWKRLDMFLFDFGFLKMLKDIWGDVYLLLRAPS